MPPTTPTAPTLNEQEKKSDRIYRFIISALCFAMCTVQIVNVIYPFFISSEFFVIHFMFGMLMCYLVYDYKGKKRYFYSPAKIFDIILALGVAAVAIYILRDIDAFLLRMDLVASPTDIVMGAICTVIVLEGCRRLTGPSLPAIALITILYALFGKYLPRPHRPQGLQLYPRHQDHFQPAGYLRYAHRRFRQYRIPVPAVWCLPQCLRR